MPTLMFRSMGGDKKWATIKTQASDEAGKLENQATGLAEQAKQKAKEVKDKVT